MYDPKLLAEWQAEQAAWAEQNRGVKETHPRYANLSDTAIQRVYTPLDVAGLDYRRDIGLPGEYPYTRGVHATGYRGKPWTMRLFSGFGSAEETNGRYKYLLEHGQNGLSVAFDLGTLMGYDDDAPEALGEFGKCGVCINSLADMEILFEGIPLDQVTTSMTINSPAAVIWAMYIAAAEKQGVPMAQLGGTIQNDILKEFTAQNEYIFPPRPSMRLVIDTFEFGTKYVPKWNTISVSGYHIREAGSSAVQELAFTLYDGIEYVKWGIERGLDVDAFAPRISFFFNCHNDFFEEVAKLRAARRIWARVMRERFGAKSPRSWLCRFHTQTAGVSLTEQQPENNVVRVAIQALAAVLGGTQSLHTDAMDEALALPSDYAARIALRTQQIILHESGVTNTVDPLGGSWYIEWLTSEMERQAQLYFDRIDAMGGMVPALESGYVQREIADTAYRYQREIDSKERIIVGVNDYLVDEPLQIPILRMDPLGERRHLERLERVRRERDNELVAQRMEQLRQACRGSENTMPAILDAVRAYATLGEICNLMREEFGEYSESWAA